MIHLDITHKLIINHRKWLVSLLVFDLDFAYLCHFTNTSLFLDSLFSFTVLFSSPLCIIPLLTSIKSLHPQTDQREGLSVSLLIPSLLDKIDHRFHQNNNVFLFSQILFFMEMCDFIFYWYAWFLKQYLHDSQLCISSQTCLQVGYST